MLLPTANRVALGLLCLLTVGASGCFQDKKQAYLAVADKNGELVPADPKDRTFEAAPDPNSKTLIRKAPPKAEEKSAAKPETIASLPDAWGVPFPPGARYAEGAEGVQSLSRDYEQVIATIEGTLNEADSFYLLQMPVAKREEHKSPTGKSITYEPSPLNGFVRNILLQTVNKKTVITVSRMRDPNVNPFGNESAEPPVASRLRNPTRPAPRFAPSAPLEPLPGMASPRKTLEAKPAETSPSPPETTPATRP